MPVVACPDCAKKLNVPESAAGKNVRCPACRKVFAVAPPPALETPSPAARPTTRAEARTKTRPEPLPLPDDDRDDEKPSRGAIAGLRCPKCDAEAVEALPPNQFSRHPGYVCTKCDARMRRAGTKGNYVAVIVLGGFIVLLALGMAVLSFDAPKEERRMQMLFAAGPLALMGGMVAVWAFRQSRLPEPIGAKVPPSRMGFWILVMLIGLLLLGGVVFGLMYVMHEML